ncbi:unnamed protein product [Soboliphyme baturini]|uniref:Peptidase S1 domain-containing protein n=1 Tax=Soboliphyme baturini TaxID=241478 RepID=A0A183J160_9BILA|nr:unnamed protein product [Soboliphyme baturini]
MLSVLLLAIVWSCLWNCNANALPARNNTVNQHRYLLVKGVFPHHTELTCLLLVEVYGRIAMGTLITVSTVPWKHFVVVPASLLQGRLLGSTDTVRIRPERIKVAFGVRQSAAAVLQSQKIKAFGIHKNYVEGKPENDIALMELKDPLILSPVVQSCVIATEHAQFHTTYAMPTFTEGTPRNGFLMKAGMTVVRHELCSRHYHYVSSKMLCAIDNSSVGIRSMALDGAPLLGTPNRVFGMLVAPAAEVEMQQVPFLDLPRKSAWIDDAARVLDISPQGITLNIC